MWAGTEACEPVTWQECKLVPKDVKFIVPEITCSDKQEIWYHEPEKNTGVWPAYPEININNNDNDDDDEMNIF